jgi:limonene-1,2-epoxide hydrolase
MKSPLQIANDWMAAFNSHDLEALLSLYDDNAQHFSPKLLVSQPETKGLIQGKEAMRTWWQDAFDRIPSLKYIPITFTANDDRIFMEYRREADGDPNMMVAEVLEIKDGKIIFSRVYHG